MSLKLKEKQITKRLSEEGIPSFIKKTYDILENETHNDIVSWNEDGTAFIIKKPTEFSQTVLPLYFKHSNLTSFVRQLNMYNFHKRRMLNFDYVYNHELFQRGKIHLLKGIRRKHHDPTITNIEKSLEAIESTQGTKDTSIVGHENLILKKLNKEALSRINYLENNIKEITILNQALWTHINSQQQKEDKLKFTMIRFLKECNIPLTEVPQNLKCELNFNGEDSFERKNPTQSTTTHKGAFLPLHKRDDETQASSETSQIEGFNISNFLSSTEKCAPHRSPIQQENGKWIVDPNAWNLEHEYLKTLASTNKIFGNKDIGDHHHHNLINTNEKLKCEVILYFLFKWEG